jgi:hypothetical protein
MIDGPFTAANLVKLKGEGRDADCWPVPPLAEGGVTVPFWKKGKEVRNALLHYPAIETRRADHRLV